jgi:hypothetical protein
MSDTRDAKIQRWRSRIDECRAETKCQTPDGRESLHSIIGSYERLIELVERQVDKRKA